MKSINLKKETIRDLFGNLYLNQDGRIYDDWVDMGDEFITLKGEFYEESDDDLIFRTLTITEVTVEKGEEAFLLNKEGLDYLNHLVEGAGNLAV